MLLSPKPERLEDLAGKRIGVPGSYTTAYMLLRLYMPLPFDSMMNAIESGEVDAGVIIHEGQLTWKQSGLNMILDLGEAWTNDTRLPIPLGLDVVNRKLGDGLIQTITQRMEESIRYAREHEDDAIDYAMEFGRGIDRETCRRFVRMYVNDDTVNMGEEGKQALELLYRRGVERGIIAEAQVLDIVSPR
jgi:1,4-dihydroxy-6-naphthoate synthase